MNEELPDYRATVDRLLTMAAERARDPDTLDERFDELFAHLVKATAWQESCWRQFIRRGNKLVPLRSPVGSVGIMQVNLRVWRGLYDQKGLLGDIAYNARAGAEILLHYLRDYGLARGEHRQPGGPDALVRAVYAVYNGGPRQLVRYRGPNAPKPIRRIVDAFFEKYQKMQQGRELEVASCFSLGN
jgi:soluble lytic murein transglycosylase-like protein